MEGKRTGTNPVKVDAEPQVLLRLRRMARELRLTDQILSFDLDSVQLVQNSPTGAPAWTSADGSTITVDVARMPGVKTRQQLAVWLGTNAHELFHNLFTPRSGSTLMVRVGNAERSVYRGIHRSWNILEDQRIERLGLSRYAAWRGYLIAALSHHIPVADRITGEAHPDSWLLIAGRTWLPAEVRAIARAAFVATNGDGVAQHAAELIGAYQRLSDPGELDAAEAWTIVEEFHDMFGAQVPPKGGCGSPVIDEGDPEPGEYQPTSYPAADEPDDDDPEDSGDDPDDSDDDPEDSDDDADDGDDDGSESDDDADADGSGDDESDDEGDDGESDDEGDDDGASGEQDQGDVEQEGDGVNGNDGERTMWEAMKDAIDEALSDDDTAADLDRVEDQVHHGTAGGGDLPRSIGVYHDLPDTARLLARDVSDVLAAIKDDNEAAWVRRTDTGRFNVGRWATDPAWDADDVFDEFQAGAMDASGLEVVLLCDVSGSMGRQIFPLSEAAWAIRTAVDRVEGAVTVLGFGDAASVISEPHNRPDGRMFVPNLEGSTEPTEACREAHRIVAGSQAANRIVVVLTDGQWFDQAKAANALLACKSEGALVVVVGLGPNAGHVVGGMFGFADVTTRINRPEELVPIFRDVATRSMLAAARR